ncbi:MAG: VOC family protein [Kiritimatiellaeota bacterium]|nr:VOC family protein [Kiritimatiellota bacterium]
MGYVKGVHHVAISVKEYDKTLDLYTRVLGMKVMFHWGKDDSRAAMLSCGDGSHVEVFAGGPGNLQEGAWKHLALCVTDVDGAYAAALKAGCASQMEPTSIDIDSAPSVTPVRIAFVRGFDNEILEFFTER